MTEFSRGMVLALIAYLIWGCFALFFHQLQHIPSTEVLLHRVVWSAVFVSIILTIGRRWSFVRVALSKPRLILSLFVSSLLIATNWGVYIWSVSVGDAVGASLGYFISPLVGVALGVLILKETILPYQAIAIALAAMGVGYKIFGAQQIPWAALTLGFTFGFYGLIRKQTQVDTVTGLMIESLLLLPFALAYWVWLTNSGTQHFDFSADGALLVAAGVLTALPLLAYAAAAKRLSLIVLGLMLYLAPSLQLISGVLILGEPFGIHQQITFGFIWASLIMLSGGAILRQRRAAKSDKATYSVR